MSKKRFIASLLFRLTEVLAVGTVRLLKTHIFIDFFNGLQTISEAEATQMKYLQPEREKIDH